MLPVVIAGMNFPHGFWGTAKMNDGSTNVSTGETVTAQIGGVEKGTQGYTITTAGIYGYDPLLLVAGDTDGEAITFYICDNEAGTSTFETGGSTELNLEISGTCEEAAAETPSTGGGGGGGGGGAAAGGAPAAGISGSEKTSLIGDLGGLGTLGLGVTTIGEVTVKKVSTTEKVVTVSVESIKAALDSATSSEATESLRDLKAYVQSNEMSELTVTQSVDVYKVTNDATGESAYRTKITLTYTAEKTMKEVDVIVVVPKTEAASVNELFFPDEKPLVLQADPVLKWVYADVSAGDILTQNYVINKRVLETQSQIAGAGGAFKIELLDILDMIRAFYDEGSLSLLKLLDIVRAYYGG